MSGLRERMDDFVLELDESEGQKDYNPDEPRDPHTGEWRALGDGSRSQVPDAQRAYIAEGAMQRGGLAGQARNIPVGKMEDGRALGTYGPKAQEASDFASEAAGFPVRVSASTYEPDFGGDGGYGSANRATQTITVRPQTDDLTILHEVAHLIADGEDSPSAGGLMGFAPGEGHGPKWAAVAYDLYKRYLGDEAASTFASLYGLPGAKGYDPNEPRDPHTGQWIHVPGGGVLEGVGSGTLTPSTPAVESLPAANSPAMKAWGDQADKFADDLRNQAPPLTKTLGAQDVQQADDAVAKYQDIGARARKIVDSNPRVVAAADVLAAADPGQRTEQARQTLANERAAAVRRLLRRTRPVGADVKSRNDPASRQLNVKGSDTGLVKDMRDESRDLPVSWLALLNSSQYGVKRSSLNPLTGNNPVAMSFNEVLGVFNVSGDHELGFDGTPMRIHEMMHALQHADHNLALTDAAYLVSHAHPPSFDWFREGDVFKANKDVPNNAFYDPYSGTDYRDGPGGTAGATELSTTGIEYLMGGLRRYRDLHHIGSDDPWSPAYVNHLNYCFGLLLKGGPPETAADFRAAGMPVPNWATKP